MDRHRDDQMPLTLMASMAYSTWNSLPSGLNVLTPLSYSLLVRNMPQSWPDQCPACCSATFKLKPEVSKSTDRGLECSPDAHSAKSG